MCDKNKLFIYALLFPHQWDTGGRPPRNHSGGSCYSEHLRLSLRIWSAKSGMKLTDKCIESWYCVVSGWEESAIGRFVGANDGIRSSLL